MTNEFFNILLGGRAPSVILPRMPPPPVPRAIADRTRFNPSVQLPYSLREDDFLLAMQDAYDLLFDINTALLGRNLPRLEEVVRPAGFSGILSDAAVAAMAKHARVLTGNRFHNGHPDLIPRGVYPRDAVQAGEEGVEVKVTKGRGAVDTHGARDGWVCLFRYEVDSSTEPARDRAPTQFTEILLAHLNLDDYRRNERGMLGTRTASANKGGLAKLRANWVYSERRHQLPPTAPASGSPVRP